MSFKTPKDDRGPTWRGGYTRTTGMAGLAPCVTLLSKLTHVVERGGILAVTACGIEFDGTQRDFLYLPWDEVGCVDCLARVAAAKLARDDR